MRVSSGSPLAVWGTSLVLIVLAICAYLGASGEIDSLYAYRSPLKDNAPAPGENLGKPAVRTLVFVLVDALRLDTSLDPQVMPFLNQLRQRGASARMHSQPPSYSEPGYSVLLTGAWPDLSDGPAINLEYDQIPTWTQDNLISSVHRARLTTAISGYYWFEKLVPQDAVDTAFYTPGEDREADRQVVDAVLPWLQQGEFSFILVHIDQVDYAGHYEGGPKDPNWNAAASRADALIQEIAARMDFSKDAMLVVSDHGQIDQGGHGGQDAITLLEPYVLAGAGIQPGDYGDVQMVDVAPTLAALLGASLPASSQGHVLDQMLALPLETAQNLPAALQAQQAQLVDAYLTAIGQPQTVLTGDNPVDAAQKIMQTERDSRLTQERLPRGLLALLFLIGVVLLVLRGWNPSRTIMLLCGGIFLLTFNLKYALLDGNTYSLSSVKSPDSLILGTFLSVSLAFLVAYLVLILISARQGEITSTWQVALKALYLSVTVNLLLMVPVLWSFYLNGLFITWTLPDFFSYFLAFLSLLQILAVSIVGLILAAVSALAFRILKLGRSIDFDNGQA